MADKKPSDDFKHNPKLQGIDRVIRKLMLSNDSELMQKEAKK